MSVESAVGLAVVWPLFGIVLIALFQRWRDKVRAKEAPIKPAVVGIGGTTATLEPHEQAVAEVEAEEAAKRADDSEPAASDVDADPPADGSSGRIHFALATPTKVIRTSSLFAAHPAIQRQRAGKEALNLSRLWW